MVAGWVRAHDASRDGWGRAQGPSGHCAACKKQFWHNKSYPRFQLKCEGWKTDQRRTLDDSWVSKDARETAGGRSANSGAAAMGQQFLFPGDRHWLRGTCFCPDLRGSLPLDQSHGWNLASDQTRHDGGSLRHSLLDPWPLAMAGIRLRSACANSRPASDSSQWRSCRRAVLQRCHEPMGRWASFSAPHAHLQPSDDTSLVAIATPRADAERPGAYGAGVVVG